MSKKGQPLEHSGYICFNDGKHIAYDFNGELLTIHVADDIREINGQKMIMTTGYDRKQYLFCSQIPFNIEFLPLYPYDYNHQVDFVIKNFEPGGKYVNAIFRFEELQWFYSSLSMAVEFEEEITFKLTPEIVKEFNVSMDRKNCKVQFLRESVGSRNQANGRARTVNEIRLSFDETSDVEFLRKIFTLVQYAFIFICNRQNITCNSMILQGKYLSKRPRCGEVVEEERSLESEMFFINKYREPDETDKIIEKTFFVGGFLKHIDKLFQMIADDLSRVKKEDEEELQRIGNSDVTESENNNEYEETAFISLGSIHSSTKRRNLIDLQQSLHITAAFEFYVRRYLPPMTEEKEHHIEVKNALQEFIGSHTGKAKKLAKGLLKHVGDVSLSEKIVAVYEGYDGWKPVKPCISEEWFDPDQIEALADAANEWRNELAHEKREYLPDINAIKAIRFVEHLNYAIVLREIGYEDVEIKSLLEFALVR